MRVRQRQLVYGSIFGVATFLVGWAITYLLTPPEILTGLPEWKATLWVFLSAHFISISGVQLGGMRTMFTKVDLIAQLPMLQSLRVVPVLITALGGIMMVEAVGYTRRFSYLLQNSGALLIGYLSAGLIAFVVSEAQPDVAMLVVLGVVIGGAAFIGGTVTQRLTGSIPVFAITSIGGIILIGLLIILGGFVILQSIAPLVAISVVGITVGAILAWIARNTP